MGKKTIAKQGREVKVHYKGSFADGTVFDNSYDRGETLSFTVGAGEMIPGFDSAVNGMKVGETKTVTIQPTEAYGDHNPEGIRAIDKQNFPSGFDFSPGVMIEGQVGDRPVRGIIQEIEGESVIVDFNHPMAGKDLNFDIELVEVN